MAAPMPRRSPRSKPWGEGITALCSTQSENFGKGVANQSEVPRGPLLDALARKELRARNQLSEEIAVEGGRNQM